MTNHAQKSCVEAITDFHTSLTSNIEYFRLEQKEYDAILLLELLNNYLSDESLESNIKVINATIYNNKISSLSFDLEHIYNQTEIEIPDFSRILENFSALMSLNIKNSNYYFVDSVLQLPNRIFFLTIANNNLEKLPTSLFKIRSLRILNVDNNNLSDLPLQMNNFTQLNSLHLSNNALERLPRFLMNFSKLKTLRINGN